MGLLDPPALTLAAASAQFRSRGYKGDLPAGLGWNSTLMPLDNMRLLDLPGGRTVGLPGLSAREVFNAHSNALTNPALTLYVDIFGSGAADTNDGLTPATALRSMAKALQKSNTAGVSTQFRVKGGIYPRTYNPWNGDGSFGPVTPQGQDIAFVADGRVITGTWNLITGQVINSTYPNCYSWSLASANRVVDIVHTTNGKYVELIKVPDAARCNITPDSWCLVSGTIYVNRRDGAAVTDSNTRVYRPSVRAFRFDVASNIFIGGLDGNSGFEVEGGGIDGGLSVDPLVKMTTDKVLCVENSKFPYGGGYTDTGGRGVSINAWRGLAYFSNCSGDYAWTDALNFHNGGSNAVAAGTMQVLTSNCTSDDVGRFGVQSCNGLTLHEDVVGVDLGGYYARGHGGAVRNIGTSKQLLLGTVLEDDYGDRDLGGGGLLPPAAVVANDSAEIWCDRTRVKMPAGGYSYWASGIGAKIHKRNVEPCAVPDTGLVDTY